VQQNRDPLGRSIEPPVDAHELSVRFAEAFCASDLDALATLLAPSFHLQGPLAQFENSRDYLNSLLEDPPEPAPCRIIRVTGSGDEAAILYEYGRSPSPLLVAQFNRVSRGLLSEPGWSSTHLR